MKTHATRTGLGVCLVLTIMILAYAAAKRFVYVAERTESTVSAVPVAMEHGDHNPRFGGLVLMQGDLHFEVVVEREGHYEVYFSDLSRGPLHASRVTDAKVTVIRPDGSQEVVALQIDAYDRAWVGEGCPLTDVTSTLRISYEREGGPYWIDVPLAVWMPSLNPAGD